MNANPRPTAQDLAGFWDLLQLSIEDISLKFDELYHLKSNDWKLDRESPDKQVSFCKESYSQTILSANPWAKNKQCTAFIVVSHKRAIIYCFSEFLVMCKHVVEKKHINNMRELNSLII